VDPYAIWALRAYTASTGVTALYVDALPAVTLTDIAPPTITGRFQIGDQQQSGTHNGFFTGQILNVQVWNASVPPFQPAVLSGTTRLFQLLATGRCLDGDVTGVVYSSACDTTNGYQHWYMWYDGTSYQLKSLATGAVRGR
jgi:hypothetical protein